MSQSNKLSIDIPENIETIFMDDFIPDIPTFGNQGINNSEDFYTTNDYNFSNLSLIDPIFEIYLDMDETIGHISKSSLFLNIWQHYKKDTQELPSYSDFKWFFDNGAFRPGLKELLQYLVTLKNNGLIKFISIYTAATNDNNYVFWIARCIEEYAGIPKLSIDSIYDRYNCIFDRFSNAYYKQIQKNSILIDDKPWYSTIPNRTLYVEPYLQHVSSEPLFNMFDSADQNAIKNILEYDSENYKVSYKDYSNDRELFRIIDGLKQIFS